MPPINQAVDIHTLIPFFIHVPILTNVQGKIIYKRKTNPQMILLQSTMLL